MSFSASTFQHSEPQPGSRSDAAWLSILGDFPALLDELPANWFESAKVSDRRAEPRCWCDSQALLTPLDEPPVNGDGSPIPIALTDISRHGIGFSHAEPLPYRMVRITFDCDDVSAPILVVRLQWCRFRKPGICESGGQIQRVSTASMGPTTVERTPFQTDPSGSRR